VSQMTARPFKEIGERLLRLRLAMEPALIQETFARKHGFRRSQYSMWEVGHRRIPPEEAITLVEAYLVSLDWIYLGRENFLPLAIRDRLRDVDPTAKRPRAGHPRGAKRSSSGGTGGGNPGDGP